MAAGRHPNTPIAMRIDTPIRGMAATDSDGGACASAKAPR